MAVLVTALVLFAWRIITPAEVEVVAAAPTSNSTPTSESHEVVIALQDLVARPERLAATGVEGLVGDVSGIFPDGTEVESVQESWQPDGTGTGGTITVVVTEPGQSPRAFLVLMVKEPDGWKVLATIEESR